MEVFQKIVLFAAIIILIITLVVIGLAIRNTKNTQQWPPFVPECPDYWTLDKNNKCVNTTNENLGKQTCRGTKDFNKSPFTGDQGMCNKYTWATDCNISWDGITYGVKNPCNT